VTDQGGQGQADSSWGERVHAQEGSIYRIFLL
jgi:hypothetical protein